MGSLILIRIIYMVYLAVTLYVVAISLSDHAFNKSMNTRKTLMRVAAAPFWFLAVMSASGREFLFGNYIKRM